MLLENKVALITGATRGIGKQIALAFAREGAQIAFTGRRAEMHRTSLSAKMANEDAQ